MPKVSVVIGTRLSEAQMRQVESVDSRLEIHDAYEFFRADRRRLSAHEGRGEGLDLMAPELLRLLAGAEVLLVDRFPASLLTLAPEVKWIQLTVAGADAFLGVELTAVPAAVTNARGTMADAIAEFVLMTMLMAAKRAPQMLDNQRLRRWERGLPMMELVGKTVGLVGLGEIGRRVARRARAFDMRLLAVRRTASQSLAATEMVDELFLPQKLGEMLPQCDFLVLAAPLTPQTEGMMGERELRLMKPSAFLINVARGQLVDEAALVRALEEGWIAGATIDVFSQEPLPPESPLWNLPNTFISPHVSGASDRARDRMVAVFCDNLKRYLAGEPLINLVDKEAGY